MGRVSFNLGGKEISPGAQEPEAGAIEIYMQAVSIKETYSWKRLLETETAKLGKEKYR